MALRETLPFSGRRLHLGEGAHKAPVLGLGFEVLDAREKI
jgi:hypothetical protein